jgi:hypothetical protein
MGGGVTEFDPGTANTGEGKIVSLILPDTAESIKAGTSYTPTFKNFGALKSVAGGAVTAIGEYAFRYYCSGLNSVSFPVAQSIGRDAFTECSGLTEVSFPAAQSIGISAFANCTGLISISLPAAQSIDAAAFIACTGLISISLPAAQSIGGGAFDRCPSLSEVNLPAVQDISLEAFGNTGTGALTVTLGGTVPTLGTELFKDVNDFKDVTLRVPDNEAWSGKTGTFTGSDTADNWGNGFRGGGWKNNKMTSNDSHDINSYINLKVEAQ